MTAIPSGQIIDGCVDIPFIEVEENAIKQHTQHIKSEIQQYKYDIESSTLTQEEIKEKKENLKKLTRMQNRTLAIMKISNIPSVSISTMEELVTSADEVYEQAASKLHDGRFDATLEKISKGADISEDFVEGTSQTDTKLDDLLLDRFCLSDIAVKIHKMDTRSLKTLYIDGWNIGYLLDDYRRILQVLPEMPELQNLDLRLCSLSQTEFGKMIGENLVAVNLYQVTLPHAGWEMWFNHMPKMTKLKKVKQEGLKCTTHGEYKCDGYHVDLSHGHTQLENVRIGECTLSACFVCHQATGLQEFGLYTVTMSDSCLRSLWQSLPTNGVTVTLRSVIFPREERNRNIINDIRNSPGTKVKHDEMGGEDGRGDWIAFMFVFVNKNV